MLSSPPRDKRNRHEPLSGSFNRGQYRYVAANRPVLFWSSGSRATCFLPTPGMSRRSKTVPVDSGKKGAILIDERT